MRESISAKNSRPRRILLGQLVSNGDCLYATAIARQIKVDYPGCRLTWGISPRCRSILDGNPDVDEVWEFVPSGGGNWLSEWDEFEAQARLRKRRGEFDEIFLTQIAPANLENYVSSTRASIFRAYPHPITVPVAPVLRLGAAEIHRAQQFARQHQLGDKSADKKTVILFECSPKSEQSRVTPEYALEFARRFLAKYPDSAVILSSNHKIEAKESGIIDGSELSLRETMGMVEYCTLFIGCSSGITWAATSEGLKPLPMIQLLVPDLNRSNSVAYDYYLRGVTTEGIIEMTEYPVDKLLDCVDVYLSQGFGAAKKEFNQPIPFRYDMYRNVQFQLLKKWRYRKARRHLRHHLNEFGFRPRFFLETAIMLLKCYFPWPFQLVSRWRGIPQ